MKVLILSFYYEPDLCAGSFRCTALVNQLLEEERGFDVEVITTLPNRYATYSKEAPKYEEREGIKIHRVALPVHQSGMIDQVRAFYYFYKAALEISKDSEYALVFATSSRLFTAFLGARVSRMKKVPLYLDIRDIFLDTLKDVLPSKFSVVLMPILNLIEKYTFGKASRVNLVSEGFRDYFEKRYPSLEYDYYTNGIDREFVRAAKEGDVLDSHSGGIKTILYAGNIGEGQGLHKIVPGLAEALGCDFKIQIIGDGGRRKQLVEALRIKEIDNVELISPVPRKELVEYYNRADILFLHLNDYDAFKKVLPSKVFEYAAFNKPILAGVSGYSAKFIDECVVNSEVFPPCDASAAVKAVKSFSYNSTPRTEFIKGYARGNIMKKMSKSILELMGS